MAVDQILMLLILLAGFYMAWNIGANDVSNAMGTSVGSGALPLFKAVIIAGILEFCGAFFLVPVKSGPCWWSLMRSESTDYDLSIVSSEHVLMQLGRR